MRTAVATSPPWCPRGTCYTEMDAILALGEAITKDHTVTPQTFLCDMCNHYHYGAGKTFVPRCARTGKVQFKEKNEADRTLGKMLAKAAAGESNRNEKSVYRCPFCKLWHLTSDEERP